MTRLWHPGRYRHDRRGRGATSFTVWATIDTESGTLTVTSPNDASGDTSGTVTTNGTTVTYTPSANFNGTTVINYTITDDGTTNGSNDFLTDYRHAHGDRDQVNDAPCRVADTVTITEDDGATAFTVLTNDTDTESGTLTVSGPTIASGENSDHQRDHGDLHAERELQRDHGDQLHHHDVWDHQRSVISTDTTATLTVTVTEVNDAPVATDDAVTMRSTSNATNIDVLDNDTDTEGGTLTVSSPSITSGDTGGTISTAGTYRYVYTVGIHRFFGDSYTITDDGTTNGSDDF